MPVFTYQARDAQGRKVRASTESPSLAELSARLRERGMILLEARETARPHKAASTVARGKTPGRIRPADIAFFFRQMATMVTAGVTINDALREMSTQAKNLTFSELVEKIREDIERGGDFSGALARHPRFFPPIVTSMIAAGEEGGNLSGVLDQVSVYLEDKLALQREVRAATTYPSLIAGFLVLALAFVTFFLIPRFRDMFEGFGVPLPLMTQLVMGISAFLFRILPWFLSALVVLVFALRRYLRTANGRRLFDRFRFGLPLVGPTMHMVAISYYCQTFSALINSGVTVIKCLGIVGRVSGNLLIEEATERIRGNVIGGRSISEEMSREPIFPPLLARMVAVGEQTGQLGEMFARVNRFYREEALTRTRMLTVTLEPIMLVGLGVIVGLVVVALYLPIFQLSGAMSI